MNYNGWKGYLTNGMLNPAPPAHDEIRVGDRFRFLLTGTVWAVDTLLQGDDFGRRYRIRHESEKWAEWRSTDELRDRNVFERLSREEAKPVEVTPEGGQLKMPTQGLLPTPHQDAPWEVHLRAEAKIRADMTESPVARINEAARAFRREQDKAEASRWRREAVRRSTTSAMVCDTFWRR